MECPITYEAFEDRGENTPIMLPTCGHTISDVAAEQLVATAKAAQEKNAKHIPVAMKCPSCAQKQPEVSTVHDLPRNLALIRRLRAKRNREKQRRSPVSERAGDGTPADAGAARKEGKQNKITFTESGDHQPCVMPACGHTFTRMAASHLLEKARASQHSERNDQTLLPSAVACMLSLVCIAAWPDGRVAGVLRVLLLCSCFYVRWRVKIRLIFGTIDPDVPTTLQCPACGTKQPEVTETLQLPPNWMLIEHLREEASGLATSKGSVQRTLDAESADADPVDPPENIPKKEDQMTSQSNPQALCGAPVTGEARPQEEDSAPACAHLSKEERDCILQRNFSCGLSHSQKVANRQVLIQAMEGAVWTYIDSTNDQQGSRVLEHLPGFLVEYLIKTVAQNILNSTEHTDIVAGACNRQGTALNRMVPGILARDTGAPAVLPSMAAAQWRSEVRGLCSPRSARTGHRRRTS